MEPKNYILLAKFTQQVSEDSWERKSKTKIITENETVGEIFQWVAKEGLDADTIQILPNN